MHDLPQFAHQRIALSDDEKSGVSYVRTAQLTLHDGSGVGIGSQLLDSQKGELEHIKELKRLEYYKILQNCTQAGS
jgi:hypothetical protein